MSAFFGVVGFLFCAVCAAMGFRVIGTGIYAAWADLEEHYKSQRRSHVEAN